jgi:YD repeat-containing protein
MVLSLALLMAVVGGFLLLVPRHHHDAVKPVDYRGDLRIFAADAPFTVLAPAGLPAYWKVTSFNTVPPEQPGKGTASMHMGIVVDRSPRTYAALEQSNEPAAAFAARVGVPAVTGTTTVAGDVWQLRRDGAGHTSLSRTADGRTVIVTDGGGKGGATLQQLEALAAALRPVAG